MRKRVTGLVVLSSQSVQNRRQNTLPGISQFESRKSRPRKIEPVKSWVFLIRIVGRGSHNLLVAAKLFGFELMIGDFGSVPNAQGLSYLNKFIFLTHNRIVLIDSVSYLLWKRWKCFHRCSKRKWKRHLCIVCTASTPWKFVQWESCLLYACRRIGKKSLLWLAWKHFEQIDCLIDRRNFNWHEASQESWSCGMNLFFL